jgi:hypothetical protein
MNLSQALLVLSILSPAFKQKELKERLTQLLGWDPSTMTQGKMTYQLRRLRTLFFPTRFLESISQDLQDSDDCQDYLVNPA